MYFKDLSTKKWKTHPKLEISYDRLPSFHTLEQECHINIIKSGFENSKKQEIYVNCSHQNFITKLSKNPNFTLCKILVSNSPQNYGFVLQVEGTLHPKTITLRQTKLKTT